MDKNHEHSPKYGVFLDYSLRIYTCRETAAAVFVSCFLCRSMLCTKIECRLPGSTYDICVFIDSKYQLNPT
jgi:hypothetical protein